MEVGGQSISFTIPFDRAAVPMDGAISGWRGWSYLNGGTASWPGVFTADGDWKPAQAMVDSISPSATALPWKIKVVFLNRVDMADHAANGLVSLKRAVLLPDMRKEAVEAVVRAARIFEAESHGQLTPSIDVSDEPEPLFGDIDAAKGEVFDDDALHTYLDSRVNGGLFVADDKVYRGPYSLVLVVHPGLTGRTIETGTINGLPLASLSTEIFGKNPGDLTNAILAAESYAARTWAASRGWKGTATLSPPRDYLQNPFNSRFHNPLMAGGFDPADGKAFTSAWRTPALGMADKLPPAVEGLSPISSNASVDIASDPQEGQVLHLGLVAMQMYGGVALPNPASGSLSEMALASPFLVFKVKTTSPDPIGLRATFSDGVKTVELGDGALAGPAIPTPADGAWHTVAVDLRMLGDLSHLQSLALAADPANWFVERISGNRIDYSFSQFTFATQPPPEALIAGPAPELTAVSDSLKGLTTKPTSDADASILTKLLAEPSDQVRLNTLIGLKGTTDPQIEPAIIQELNDLYPRSCRLAATILGGYSDATAETALRKALLLGPAEAVKGAAGIALAQRHDPKMLGPLSVLIGSHSWQTRLDGAIAVATNGGDEAQKLLVVWLQQTDPEIRLQTVGLVSPAGAAASGLLYLSVNDPSDQVRAAAAIKLLQNPDASISRQAYRAIEDDSWWVCQHVLQWLTAHPVSATRPTILQAVVNPNPEVRVAALDALAALPNPVSLPEIQNTLTDELPSVEMALINCAKKKGIRLPATTVAMLTNSPDPDVVSAANSLDLGT